MKLKSLTYLVLVVTAAYWASTLSSCAKNNEVDLQKSHKDSTSSSSAGCDTVNMTYSANVVPILSANCYSCHSAANYQNNSGINLEDFTKLSSEVRKGHLLNSIKQNGISKPMPINGPQLSACDINKIADWINRGAQNN